MFIKFRKFSTNPDKILEGSFQAAFGQPISSRVAVGYSGKESVIITPLDSKIYGDIRFMSSVSVLQPVTISSASCDAAKVVASDHLVFPSVVTASTAELRQTAVFHANLSMNAGNFTSNVTVGSTVFTTNLHVFGVSYSDGPFFAAGRLDISGTGYFYSSAIVKHDIKVGDTARFQDVLQVRQDFNSTSFTSINAELAIANDTLLATSATFLGLLSIDSSFSFSSSSLAVSKPLNMQGLQVFESFCVFDAPVKLYASSAVNKSVHFYGNASLTTLRSASDFISTSSWLLNASYFGSNGVLMLNSGATISGNALFRSRIATSAMQCFSSLTVSTSSIFSNSVSTKALASLGGDSVSFSSWDSTTGPVIFHLQLTSGSLNVGSSLLAAGPSVFFRGASFYGPCSMWNATITSRLRSLQNFSVNGYTTMYSPLTVSGNITVAGRASFLAATTFNSRATIEKNLDIMGTVVLFGAAQFAKDARILGPVVVDNVLSAEDRSQFASNLFIQKSLVAHDVVYIVGRGSVLGNVSLTNDLVVSQNAVFSSNLRVNVSSSLRGFVSVNSSLHCGSNFSADSTVSCSGSFQVSGTSLFSSNVTARADISLSGPTLFLDNVNVQGNFSSSSSVPVFRGSVSSYGSNSRFSNPSIHGDILIEQSPFLLRDVGWFQQPVESSSFFNYTASLEVRGPLTLTGSGSSSFASLRTESPVTVDSFLAKGGATLYSDLVMAGNTTAKGGVVVASSGNFSCGASFLTDPLYTTSFSNKLFIYGPLNISSQQSVFNGPVVYRGTLTISTSAISTPFAAQFSNVYANGRLQVQSAMSTAGKTFFSGETLIASSGSIIKRSGLPASFSNRVDVTGATFITSSLTVSSGSVFKSSFQIVGAVAPLAVHSSTWLGNSVSLMQSEFRSSLSVTNVSLFDSATTNAVASVFIAGATNVTYNMEFKPYTTVKFNAQFRFVGNPGGGLVNPLLQIDTRLDQFGPPYKAYQYVGASSTLVQVGCYTVKIGGSTKCLLFRIY
jgi:cytoskeletal protein CcmA (bactofilin family)